jgi:FtsP/CotA-like multicopper oxidase with cupredoxin domain
MRLAVGETLQFVDREQADLVAVWQFNQLQHFELREGAADRLDRQAQEIVGRMGRSGVAGMMGINGRPMKMDRIDVRVPLGNIEIWEIVNPTPLTHPFHIHDVQFRILDREGQPPLPHEHGLKDTVLVNPGSTVRVITEFADFADPKRPYMYHCHNLEHDDAGMMGQFVVV